MPSARSADHASSSRKRRSFRSHAPAAAALVLAVAGALLVGASAAHAAGDPTLSRLIIPDPEPGWSNLSTTETDDFQTQLQTELQTLQSQNQTFTSAVAGWQSPSGNSSDSLVVFLVEAVGGSTQNITAANLASGFCSGATNTNSVATPPIPNVPSSAIATCSDTTESVTVGTATKSNLIEMIASFGTSPLAVSNVEQVVGDQLDALPSSTSGTTTAPAPSSSGGSSGGSNTGIIIGGAGGGGVVVIGGVLAFVLLRRRRSAPATAGAAPVAPTSGPPSPPGVPGHDPWGGADPGWVSSLDVPPTSDHQADALPGSAPGWYPEGGDPETMRYWDGTTFTARKRWNGSAWVDA